jgi:hypothetical protein
MRKKTFKRLAGYLVAIYANRLYKKAVQKADAAYTKTRGRNYVVSGFNDVSKLLVINREEFRAAKKTFNLQGHDISKLKQGAWYYTMDRSGEGMSEKDKEIRRLAFIRHMLKRAKLA